MHIFPGLFYFSGLEQFFRTNYTTALLDIIHTHSARVKMLIGAHIHWADVRSPYSTQYPDLTPILIANPSISPIFNNNPGYAVLTLEDTTESKIDSLEWRFFQLYMYIFMSMRSYTHVDVASKFSVDLNSPASIREYVMR